jgi:RNA polymerase sigma factor (TIGR02999 family)
VPINELFLEPDAGQRGAGWYPRIRHRGSARAASNSWGELFLPMACLDFAIIWRSFLPFAATISMTDVTQILSRIESGDFSASEQLLPLVYQELRRLAAQRLAYEKPGQTLQATALVHEAYLRLLGPAGSQRPWSSRGHFFAAAAEAMRRILIEAARRKKSAKHGGNFCRHELGENELLVNEPSLDLLALDDALNQLAARNVRQAELVKLRFFAGLSISQAADALGIAESTADADWAYAKAWLRVQMSD